MRKNENRLTTWAAAFLVALLAYAGSYMTARHFYAATGRTHTFIPKRLTVAGTIEGEMVSRMNTLFLPAIWLEEKLSGNRVHFWVVDPAPGFKHADFTTVP